jgi:hypothetical protein
MARSTTTIESVWAAKGNLPDNAIVATADGKYPALDGSLITNISGGGSGDLLAANNLSELTATASVARTNLELGAADTVEFGGFVPPSGTTAEIDAVTNADVGSVMIDSQRNRSVIFDAVNSYKDIGSTTAVVEVGAYGTPLENGNYFKAAYIKVKALTPNGLALSAENRAVLVLGAGRYDLDGVEVAIDAEFVDIVVAANLGSDPESLKTKKMSVFTNGNFDVSANDIFIYGLGGDGLMTAEINSSKPLQVWQSCAFDGGPSFGPFADGTFINCIGDSSCFGSIGGSSSGRFVNCVSTGTSTFGNTCGASGTYIKCKSIATGSAGGPFGSGADASGYFEDCEASINGSFGGYNVGTIGTCSGTFVRCKGTGDYSFAGYSTFSGTAKNCESGTNGFGANGTLTGTLLRCNSDSAFQTVSGAGKTRLCLDGTLTENNQG